MSQCDVPDIQVIFNGQWFCSLPLCEAVDSAAPDAWTHTEEGDAGGMCQATGASTTSRTGACSSSGSEYPALHITKDDIWHYLYGLLHAPDYRQKYHADLSKDLPRIPFAPDFQAFQAAGAELASLHLGYETGPAYDLQVDVNGGGDRVFRLSHKAMQWGGTRKEPDRSVLHVTPAVTLRGIPGAAHKYVVNGRTPWSG